MSSGDQMSPDWDYVAENKKLKLALAKVGSYFDTSHECPECEFATILDRRQTVALEALGMTAWQCLDYCIENRDNG